MAGGLLVIEKGSGPSGASEKAHGHRKGVQRNPEGDRLTELGYTREPDFVPVPASRVQPFRKARAKSKSATERLCTTDPEKPVLGHDGRAHKSQGKRKRAFTAAELKALGR